MFSEQSLISFKKGLRGLLILPEDENYNDARKVYNGMIDKKPALIVQCAEVADVIACVNFGRENSLLIAVKGGGHNGGGLGICEDGLVIDLSLMKGVVVNQENKTVRTEGGCLLVDVDNTTHAFGLAVPSGVFSGTGIAGLTLGGGLGYLTRKYGLSIDNLLEVSIVLADGTLVKASADENADLFWAVRGGGGNFGVVVSFLFQAKPVSLVYGGPIFWNFEEAKEILQWYRSFIKEADDEINGFFAFITVPPAPQFPSAFHNKRMCCITWCYTGNMEDAVKVFDSIRSVKPPAIDLCGPIPFPVLQSLFDPVLPPGMQWYWKADHVNELCDDAIALHLKFAGTPPAWLSTMHLYPINGFAARVEKNATAWYYRDATWAMVICGIDADSNGKVAITEWAKAYWNALHPYSAGAGYVNFMMEEGEENIRLSYNDNYNKLSEIKGKYDTNNLFNVNQNIRPLKTMAISS